MKCSHEQYKNKHIDQEALVLTCGPSFGETSFEKIKELSKNKIVATVKQTVQKVGDISDYHFFNDNNFYNYETKATKIASSGNYDWARQFVWGSQDIDLFFKIKNATSKIEDSLSYKKNFEDMLIDNSLERPWGPGIMYETVIPFLIYMGIKNISIIGWDYTTKYDGTLDHYYDESRATKILKNTGNKIGTMVDLEKSVFLESTGPFYDFLRQKCGVEISLMSNCSELSKKIKRIKI